MNDVGGLQCITTLSVAVRARLADLPVQLQSSVSLGYLSAEPTLAAGLKNELLAAKR